MNNIDNIISRIKNDANLSIDKIRADADLEIKKIKDEWAEKAKLEIDAINKRETQELKNISDRSITSSEIKKQKIKLSVRNDAILDTVEKAREKIINLPIDSYVDMLKKLYAKNVPTKDATIFFNKKDLDRLPKDIYEYFISNAKGCKVDISKNPVDIDGGFLIDFGDVVWNMSIRSLIDKNMEEIIDKTNKILFD